MVKAQGPKGLLRVQYLMAIERCTFLNRLREALNVSTFHTAVDSETTATSNVLRKSFYQTKIACISSFTRNKVKSEVIIDPKNKKYTIQ